MLDTPFRARFAVWTAPLARGLVRAGVHPIAITLVAFGLTLPAAWLVATGRPALGLGIWLVSRVLDGLDGVVARQGGTASAFGGYLDITLDMAGYSAMAVGFALAHPGLQLAFLLILVGYVLCGTSVLALSSILEAKRAQLPGNDRSLQLTPGYAEAGETSLIYTLWVLLPSEVSWLAWVWVAVLFATVIERTVLAKRLLS